MANKLQPCKEIVQLRSKKYEPGVTLITPTGDRQLAFQRAELYMSRQTYTGPLQWIVVDDGQEPTIITKDQCYIRHQPVGDKAKSLCRNIESALFYVVFDKILIIEDDDYYYPEYIERMVQRLEKFDLAGEGIARYYNVVHRKYNINGNRKHASLAQTAFSSKIIEAAYVSCQRRTSAFVDCRLWDKNVRKNVFCDQIFCIGIKGLPGRKGIGSGHRPHGPRYKFDPEMKMLRQWIPIPEDVDFYATFYDAAIKK